MPYTPIASQGMILGGFTQLNRALRRIEGKDDFGLAYQLAYRPRVIGDTVAKSAPGEVTHRTGRHGDAGNPRLEDSVRVSVTLKSASVYSTALHGGVQNVGGRVGRDHATILKRAEVSGWMIKAVAENRAFVEAELNGVLDWLEFEFNAL